MNVPSNLPLSPHVQEGLRVVETGRFSKKKKWGEGLSVLSESTATLPLIKRNALAIEKVLSEMPVSIKHHELVVGSSIQTLLLNMATLPEYATKNELQSAAERLTSPDSIFGHFSPSYPHFLELGFNGLIEQANKNLLDNIEQADREMPEDKKKKDYILRGTGLSIFCAVISSRRAAKRQRYATVMKYPC